MAGVEIARASGRIVALARQPHPQHVDRRAEVFDLEPRARAHDGMAAVRADHEIAPDLQRSLGRLRPHADDAAVRLDQIRDLAPPSAA